MQRSIASFFAASSSSTSPTNKKVVMSAALATSASSSSASPSSSPSRSPATKIKRALSDASSTCDTEAKRTKTTTPVSDESQSTTETDEQVTSADGPTDAAAAIAPPTTGKGWLRGLVTCEHWRVALNKEMNKAYFGKLESYVEAQTKRGKEIYPPRADIFAALNMCPLPDIKVVILGQDPYHGPGQAHGLAFSVQDGVKVPPSLRNIYKEAKSDVGLQVPTHGNLTEWAKQGVLMLNTVLTVEKAQPNSHKKQGWETFTDEVIKVLNKSEEPLVFLLWGKPANAKAANVNKTKHLVISSSHPSPLGATKTASPFIGSKCFSRANEFLQDNGKDPINWQV
jgi:uracil-DNA glycosylase